LLGVMVIIPAFAEPAMKPSAVVSISERNVLVFIGTFI
jgi:hypothetical protein